MRAVTPMILFRADATPTMGTGHVMRCLTLAEALRDRGFDVAFAAAALTPSIERRLAAERIPVRPIDPATDDLAGATLAIARELGANAVVVDAYHLSADWRLALRSFGVPILAFQDQDDGVSLHADLVLNAAADPTDGKWRRAAPDASFLTGPRHVLLRRELRRAMVAASDPVGARRSILVTFGGADPAGLTLPVTAALDRLLGPDATLDVVIGGSVPEAGGLAVRVAALGERIAIHRKRIAIHLDPLEMGPLIGRAGLAVSAAGGTIGELAALGVPALIAIVAENQVAGSAAAVADGWCEAFDARDPYAVEAIAQRAATLWADRPQREAMARRTRGLIDADGAERVVDALIGAMQTLW
jgi:UDP-2,4-diacetamido-2,4,6-trideoxy-beta-L-altropyranose hydrolase